MNTVMEQLDSTEWLRGLHRKSARERIPLVAHLELTRRCNLRCRHCYLGEQLDPHQERSRERNTAEVCQSLDEWAAAGCLQLVITGGDPMIRKDFAEIYGYAARLGLFVTVFCDGLLVDDAIIDVFREYPPRSVEISIYGATAGTYEKVTRVPGSHSRAWAGINRLLDAGVNVALKTVLLTLNEHELGAMAAQAESAGCAFRFDSAVFPCLSASSGADPVSYRVDPETVVKWDLTFPGHAQKWADNIEKYRHRPLSDAVYACGAGSSFFFAAADGTLSPCLMTVNYRYKQDGRAFQELWENELATIRMRKRERQEGGCLVGEQRGACSHCPAINYLETGDEEMDSDYMCTTARLRYQSVMAVQERS